jgi:predicted permease
VATTSRPAARRDSRAFRALLTLYPGEFRDEYGRELTLVFADRHRQAASTWERGLVWFEAVRGVFIEAPKEHLHMIRQDLRHAVRGFIQKPLFALTVITTLALGIGANTGVFQLIEAVGLRNLPVRNPQELVEVRIVGGNGGFGLNPGRYGGLTQPIWHDLRTTQQALSGAFAWSVDGVRVGEDSDLRRSNALLVSGEFFDVLGVQPAQGRLLGREDEAAACPGTTAVVSHAYWQRQMGGVALDGRTRLRVDGQWHQVVGVTQAGFTGVAVGESFDVVMALCRQRQWRNEMFDVAVMGRLRPGWTIERAAAHVDALSAGLFANNAPTAYNAGALTRFKAFRLGVYPAPAGVSVLRDQYDRSLWLLLGMTGLVLLIACANLANLLLARATQREREVAVRLALGASRLVLVRQLLTESAVLAVCGAALGAALAQALSRVLIWALSTQSGAPILSLALNWRVLGFTALVAVATCLVFGVAPAVRATRVSPTAAMRGGRGLTAERGRLFAHRLMVVTQIAISLVLLVGALLFARSFRNLMTFDPGMRQADITVGYFGYPGAKLPPERFSSYQRELADSIRALPGVISVGTTTNVPLLGGSWSHGIRVDGVGDSAKFTWVSAGYFETMGIPVVKGRNFTRDDTQASPRVAVVNQAFVRRFIGDGDPLGRLLTTAPEPRFPSSTYQIVGVIPDTRYNDYRSSTPPMVFGPDAQFPGLGPWTVMMVRSGLDPAALTAAIRQRVTPAHPSLIFETTALQASIRDGLVRERLLAILSGLFGALAALLAMVGLYGMMSYATSQRRQEIGVRVALGASRASVVAMVMRDAGRLVVIGVAVGASLSLLATRGTAALLFGITPNDPVTIMGAVCLLAGIAAVAAFVPARRAASLDPLSALRQE